MRRVLGLFVRNFQQLQDDGLILAEHFAGGDAEQQGVTDLTSGAGNGNTDRLLAHGEKLQEVTKTGKVQRSTSACYQQPVPRKQPWSLPRFMASVNLSYVLYKI